MKNLTTADRDFLRNCLSAISEKVDLLTDFDSGDAMDEYHLATPREIYDHLDKFVVGQHEAKRTLAIAVHNHYKRLLIFKESNYTKKLDKTNVLIIGPTGTGKTYMVKRLAEFMDVPYYIGDANSLTSAGYVGKDVEDLVACLIDNAGGSPEAAASGIIFIDEFDKICKRSGSNATKDIGGEGVQQALLKLIEGAEIVITKSSGLTKTQITIDTSHILFIVGGAFVGLEEIIQARMRKAGTKIGFGATIDPKKEADASLIHQARPEDIEKFGFIPELIGRLPLLATLNELTEDDLVQIMTGVEDNVVGQYKELFAYNMLDVDFDSESLRAIAQHAKKNKTGARGLRSIVEKVLKDHMFDLTNANITRKDVECLFTTS